MEYLNTTITEKKYKRFVKVLVLKNDPDLIEEYRQWHASGNVWPEILQGLRQVGVLDMEIYIDGSTLVMIMDTNSTFIDELQMKELAKLPRQQEWETLMTKYQETNPEASAKEKWRLLTRIFKLE